MTRIVFFTFAGRQANMEVQRPYIERLLADHPTAVLHLWDLTREESDQHYIKRWSSEHDRVIYIGNLHFGHPIQCFGDYRGRGHRRCTCMKHKPPYEQPYRYYRDLGNYDDDTVFVKFDDDVLWMDTDRFDEVLAFLETEPNAIASANVTNNAVCAKYEPTLCGLVERAFPVGDPQEPENDHLWWALHTSAEFAILSHDWMNEFIHAEIHPTDEQSFRTRPGEAISINFIAMKYPVLCKAADMMIDGRLGDEGTVDSLLPWIIPNFRVAHLSFGPQEHDLDPGVVSEIRKQYRIEGDN